MKGNSITEGGFDPETGNYVLPEMPPVGEGEFKYDYYTGELVNPCKPKIIERKTTALNSENFLDSVQGNTLSIIRIGKGDNLNLSKKASGLVNNYGDRINFFTIPFHDLPDSIKRDTTDSKFSRLRPPFSVVYWNGMQIGPVITGTMLENAEFIERILKLNYTSSK